MLGRRCTPIALDCSEHSVKAVQLEQRGARLRLRAARVCEIQAGGDQATRPERVLSASRAALDGGAFRGREVVLALPLADVTIRHVRIPHEQLDRAAAAITAEVQAHGQGDVAVCSIPVADLVDRGVQKREFLCWIAPAHLVHEQIRLAEQLGLEPAAIDLDACAQARAFVQASSDSSFLHVDLGTRCSRITVVKGGTPVVMRTAPVGGGEMEMALKAKLQLDVDAILDLAAAELDSQGIATAVTATLTGHLDLVLARVADCVRYCASLFRGKAVSRMRVFGAVAGLPGVIGYLGRRIGIKTELADPMGALGLDPGAAPRLLDRGGYATALGLALRGMRS